MRNLRTPTGSARKVRVGAGLTGGASSQKFHRSLETNNTGGQYVADFRIELGTGPFPFVVYDHKGRKWFSFKTKRVADEGVAAMMMALNDARFGGDLEVMWQCVKDAEAAEGKKG